MASKPRNIVIIMADQLTARALNCYGNQAVISPHIDSLAESGVRFQTAYCNSPLCTPARYAFMTGQYISDCGGYDNAAYLPSTMPTFAHYLRLMGYQTILAGKMHFVGADQLHGFETRLTTDIYPADFGWVPNWHEPEARIDLWYHNMSSVCQAGVAAISNQLTYDDEVGACSLRAIYDQARTTDPRPFCLVSSFIHPHDPYAARQRYWDLYQTSDIELPRVPRPAPEHNDPHNLRLEKVIDLDAVSLTDQQILNARRAYYANVSYIDEWVGRLVGTLDECGLRDNTVVMFVADHGDMLGEFGLWYKMSFREWSSRIPMILSGPGIEAGGVCTTPVSQVDVLPTLVDIASHDNGEPVPAQIDPWRGDSLLEVLADPAAHDQRIVVGEYLAEGTSGPMLMLRQRDLKYIRSQPDPEQLFNLHEDPEEQRNLAGDREAASDTGELIGRLRALRRFADLHWDSEALKAQVIRDQDRRRAVSAALRIGSHTGWDYQPRRDATQEYTRSHLDLTRFDIQSRFPRPRPFPDADQ